MRRAERDRERAEVGVAVEHVAGSVADFAGLVGRAGIEFI